MVAVWPLENEPTMVPLELMEYEVNVPADAPSWLTASAVEPPPANWGERSSRPRAREVDVPGCHPEEEVKPVGMEPTGTE